MNKKEKVRGIGKETVYGTRESCWEKKGTRWKGQGGG